MEKLAPELIAPTFDRVDIFDRQINLEDYRDKKLLIGFFRHAGCPFCNLRVHSLTKEHERLKEKGMEMIFFFESPKNILLRSSFHQEVSPIPLISDPERKIYDAYGLEQSAYKSTVSHITTFVQTAFRAKRAGVPIHPMAAGESINTIPAEFLVDQGLKIKEVHYSRSLTDRLAITKIHEFANG
ncbi:MAG: AhpC/TSA family protein [Cyclobacteriaceae bacterium]|nr:AhpC/TSA family protein [Cyclobacteriaceae bacterium]MCH8517932.1 AhpC/TSA family protein [Cyclobacteriaceae bacterium]